MRRCTKCGETKPVAEFTPNRHHGSGFNTWCKSCSSAYQKDLRAKRRKEGHCPTCNRYGPQGRLYRSDKEVQATRMVKEAQRRVRQNGGECDLDVEYIYRVWFDDCPYCGMPLEAGLNGTVSGSSPTLDKIEPAKSYVRGNVVVVHHDCNRRKSDMTAADLRLLADAIDETVRMLATLH